MWFWLIVVTSLALGLGVLALLDRRARRRGHMLRSASGIFRTSRENKRDARVFDSTHGLISQDVSWTAWSRRKENNDRENRRDNGDEM